MRMPISSIRVIRSSYSVTARMALSLLLPKLLGKHFDAFFSENIEILLKLVHDCCYWQRFEMPAG